MTKYYVFNKTKYPFEDDVTEEQATKWYIMSKQKNPEMGEEKNIYNATSETIKKSGTQFFKDLYQVVRHPIETVKSIGALGHSIINLIRPGEQGNEELSKMVGQYFVDRYGGIENIKKTFRTDPVGFAADLSIILTGGASLMPKMAQTSGKVAKIVNATKKAVQISGKAIDPIVLTLKTAAAAKNFIVIPVLGVTADAITGIKPGLNTLRAYEAGKKGGNTQEAWKAGRGGTLESLPLIGSRLADSKWVSENFGLKQNTTGFTNKLLDDLEELKIVNRAKWQKSKEFLNLKNIKISKQEITKILKNAEKNGKFKGVWRNKADEKMFKTLIDIKDEVFSANIRKNGMGADLYIHRLNDLLKNNKKSAALIENVKNGVKNNLNNKTGNYNKLSLAFEEIAKVEKMADEIIGLKNPENIINNIKKILKTNNSKKTLLKNLNPESTININALEAGMRMAPTTGNIVSSIAKGGATGLALQSAGLGPTISSMGTLMPLITGPRAIGGLANTLGRGRRALTPNQKIQTGLGTSARLARALQQTEDDTVFYGN